jgi:hypothetical protein
VGLESRHRLTSVRAKSELSAWLIHDLGAQSEVSAQFVAKFQSQQVGLHFSIVHTLTGKMS